MYLDKCGGDIMKKVLFFIHDLMHGGAEKVLVNLVNNMDQNKFDVTVLTLFDEGVNKKFLDKSVNYKYVFKKSFRGNTLVLKLFSPQFLYKYMIKDEYDIVVAYLEGSCTRIISGCNDDNVKKFAWVHTPEEIDNFVYSYKSFEEAKNCYLKFDKIVCVSQDIVDSFKKLTGIEDNIIVKYNTNETQQIVELSKEKINDISIDNSYLNICAVGKIVHNKGFMRLAHVCKKLINEGYKINTYILGVGSEQKHIEEYIKRNHIQDNFKFLGYKENPYKYIRVCDVLVCSSYKEGFSTVITESLIIGTPVISTLCSGVYELLGKENEYGVAVENSEEGLYLGLKEFLENKTYLNHYKVKSKERGYLFSKDITVKKVEELFI